MAKVDRFAHLRVRLIDGLAGFGSGDLDQLTSACREDVTNTVQRRGAFVGRQCLPGACGVSGILDEGIDRLVCGKSLLAGTHGFDAARRAGDSRGNVACPLAVSSQSGIGIRLGGERTTRALGEAPPLSGHPCLALGQTVLGPVRPGHGRIRINVRQRGEEAVALAGEDILVCGNVEDPGHEVLGRGVLLEAAHQVGNSNVELTRINDRDVEKEGANVAAHNLLNAGGHAGEHLELDAIFDATRGAQFIGEGNIKDVLSGHTQADRTGTLRRHRPAQHPLVVGVGGLLGRPRRQFPAVDLSVHPLHGQVRALDDADLNARAPRVHACARPLLEALERTERIGQVSLEDNAGLVAAHIRLIEDRGKHRDRQVEVLVILHIEVEEGPVVASEAVERQEGAHAVVDDLLEAPRVVGACDRGDLDGHVVDILAGHEARDLGQAVGRFLLAEDGLTEKVDVQAVPALAQACERGAEPLIRRVNNEVADNLTEHSTCGSCHRTRSEERSSRAEPHRRGQGRWQEVLATSRQTLHGRTGHIQVRGTHDVVDESGRESKSVRIGEDAGQELGRARRGLKRRFIGPAAGADDRPLPQGPQVIGAASSVGYVVGRGGNSGVRHA